MYVAEGLPRPSTPTPKDWCVSALNWKLTRCFNVLSVDFLSRSICSVMKSAESMHRAPASSRNRSLVHLLVKGSDFRSSRGVDTQHGGASGGIHRLRCSNGCWFSSILKSNITSNPPSLQSLQSTIHHQTCIRQTFAIAHKKPCVAKHSCLPKVLEKLFFSSNTE